MNYYGIGLKSKMKVGGNSPNTCVTNAPVGTSCLTGQYCSIQGPLLGMAIIDFSPPTACIASSGIIKASYQGGKSSSFTTCLLYKLWPKHVVCSAGVMLSISVTQPRAMANNLNREWGVKRLPQSLPDQKYIGKHLTWHWYFHIHSLIYYLHIIITCDFLESYCSPTQSTTIQIPPYHHVV